VFLARAALIPPCAPQVEEDNREILRLLRDPGVQEKLEGLKRLIAQSARPQPRTRARAPMRVGWRCV
jgi:hypothetical protein